MQLSFLRIWLQKGFNTDVVIFEIYGINEERGG